MTAWDGQEILAILRDRLLKIAMVDGDYKTAIPALSIHRRSTSTDPMPCIYGLGLAITVAGHKQVTVGQEVFNYGAGQALLASVDLPVVSHVTHATAAVPYLGMMLGLNPHLITKVASGMTTPRLPKQSNCSPLLKGTLEPALLNALERLVAVLDEPRLLDVVAPLIQQEIIARLLASEHGVQFMALIAGGFPGNQIAQTMAWLKQHYTDPINIEALAGRVHLSASTFRKHFKAVAGMSPLQYLKQLRLQEARQLMLNEGLDAGAAGLRVGYESISQFTREYARLFGEPPLRDIRRLREQGKS